MQIVIQSSKNGSFSEYNVSFVVSGGYTSGGK